MRTPLLFRITRTEVGEVATLSVCTLWRGEVCLYRGYGIEHSPVRMATGKYPAKKTLSKRFGKVTWEVLNVFDGERLRTGIRVHSANYARDLRGCLSLGMAQSDLDGDGTVDLLSSRRGIQLFEQACGADEEMAVEVNDPAI